MIANAAIQRVAQGGLPQNELMLLKNETGHASQGSEFLGHVYASYALNADSAAGYGGKHVDRAQESGFPRPGCSQQHSETARFKAQAHGVQGNLVAIAFADIKKFNHCNLLKLKGEIRNKVCQKHDRRKTKQCQEKVLGSLHACVSLEHYKNMVAPMCPSV